MGGYLFQWAGRCGVWMVNDLCFSWFLCLCHPHPLNVIFCLLVLTLGACARGLQYSVCVCVCVSPVHKALRRVVL